MPLQNDRYLVLTAKLLDARSTAADAKNSGDKAAQRAAGGLTRQLMQGTPMLK
jgi:hypothetical protein